MSSPRLRHVRQRVVSSDRELAPAGLILGVPWRKRSTADAHEVLNVGRASLADADPEIVTRL